MTSRTLIPLVFSMQQSIELMQSTYLDATSIPDEHIGWAIQEGLVKLGHLAG